MTETGVAGGYVRHRDRMVQESVFQDLKDTLIACRWLPGTTARPVGNPYDPEAGFEVVTVAANQVLGLLEGHAITLIDYFPESKDGGAGTAPNTFAVDTGTPGEAVPLELGSNAEARSYVFSMAFYAVSDAVALAVLNDLRDRYLGRLVRHDVIELIDYLGTPARAADSVVVRMDVESFRYTVNTEAVTPHEVHLYFGELVLVDYVD